MAFRLPRLPKNVALVDKGGNPTKIFQQWFQSLVEAIESAIGTIQVNVAAIQAALEAAGIALAAAESAQTTADSAAVDAAAAVADAAAAQATADAAMASGSGNSAATNLALSYPDTVSITSTDNGTNADIDITAHNRIYGDATSVAVGADVLTGLTYGTKYYIYYDDPARTGGAVTYVATTSLSTAAQTGNRHTVGSITTAISGGPLTVGSRLRPPGTVGL